MQGGSGETATLALSQKIREEVACFRCTFPYKGPCTENPSMGFFQDLPLRRQVMKRLFLVYMSRKHHYSSSEPS